MVSTALSMQISMFGYAQGKSKPDSSTEATIRARFEAGTAAWNRGDLNSYLDGYLDSKKTRWVSGGIVLRGKEAIAAAFKARFPTPKEMGRFEGLELEIEVIGGDDAVVFGEWAHTVLETTRKGYFTVHLKRVDNEWFVISDHTSTVS